MHNITSLQIGQNKIEIEGKWVQSLRTLMPYSITVSSGKRVFELSDYLPNDDYVYQLDVHIMGNGNFISHLYTDFEQYDPLRVRAMTHGYNDCEYCLLIGKERKIYINLSNNANELAVQILKYKRLYKDARILNGG